MKKQTAKPGIKPLTFKIDQAAQLLSVSPASVRRLIARGDLVAIRKFRHVLVTSASLEALVQQ